MKTIALLLILLITTSNCMSIYDKYPLNFSSKRSIMTLLNQVESMLKNGGPLDAITKMLTEFETTIKEEQYSHDNLYAEQRASCATEIEIRTTAVREADSALADDGTRLQSCQSQEHRAKDDYEVTERQLIENRNQLGGLVLSRRSEENAFQTVFNTYNVTKDSVRVALQILQEIWEGNKPAATGFLQLAKHMNKLISHTSVSRTTHLLNGVMSALSQITSKDLSADEAMFERVKTMLNNFVDRQTKIFESAYSQNEAAIVEFNRSQAILQTLIDHLSSQKSELESELKKLATCIVIQTGNAYSADGKKKRNTELLEAAKSLCSAADEEYVSAKAARTEELDLLGQIKERVKARFAQISSGVTERGELDADQFSHNNVNAVNTPTFKPSTGL